MHSPLRLFIKGLLKHWWALLSCAAFTILAVLAAESNESNSWTIRGTVALAGVFFIIATYRTWRDEHQQVDSLHDKISVLTERNTKPDIKQLHEPIIHLEPEGGQVYHSGQYGNFVLNIANTGLENVERIWIFVTCFLAQHSPKSPNGIILKAVGPHYTVPNQVIELLKAKDQPVPVPINVSDLIPILREAGANGKVYHLYGIRIIVQFRRQADGRDFEIVRAYQMDLHGAGLFSPIPTSIGKCQWSAAGQHFEFGAVIPYLQSSEHWSDVVHMISGDGPGKYE